MAWVWTACEVLKSFDRETWVWITTRADIFMNSCGSVVLVARITISPYKPSRLWRFKPENECFRYFVTFKIGKQYAYNLHYKNNIAKILLSSVCRNLQVRRKKIEIDEENSEFSQLFTSSYRNGLIIFAATIFHKCNIEKTGSNNLIIRFVIFPRSWWRLLTQHRIGLID